MDHAETKAPEAAALCKRIEATQARIGVIGMGCVGLPLARMFANAGFATLGFDIDAAKVGMLNAGRSYIAHIVSGDIAGIVKSGRFSSTGDFGRAADCDVLIICVPTPLTRHREPDLGFVERTAEAIDGGLKPGCLVVLESTSYPGTTDEMLRPILARAGLEIGREMFLAYSPERENRGNAQFSTDRIPKVIDAAKTKPFGFMPFYPGPGLDGHGIPIDPFYLTWKAREHDIPTRFIELAGEISTRMPGYVVERVVQALSDRAGKAISRARVLILGIAYKKDIDDTRESPGLTLMAKLEALGAAVDYHDPHVPELPPTGAHPALAGRRFGAMGPGGLRRLRRGADRHRPRRGRLCGAGRGDASVIDSRNATREVTDGRQKIVKT